MHFQYLNYLKQGTQGIGKQDSDLMLVFNLAQSKDTEEKNRKKESLFFQSVLDFLCLLASLLACLLEGTTNKYIHNVFAYVRIVAVMGNLRTVSDSCDTPCNCLKACSFPFRRLLDSLRWIGYLLLLQKA